MPLSLGNIEEGKGRVYVMMLFVPRYVCGENICRSIATTRNDTKVPELVCWMVAIKRSQDCLFLLLFKTIQDFYNNILKM